MKKTTFFILALCALLFVKKSFAEDFQYLKTLYGHRGKVTYVRFNAASTQVISGDEFGTILLWDVASGNILKQFDGHSGMITDLQFDKKEDKLASAAYDGTIRLWDINSTNTLRTFQNPAIPPYHGVQGNEPTFVRFSPDEKALWFGGYNMKVMRASLETNQVQEVYTGEKYGITSAEFTPDGKYLLFGSGGTVTFINRFTRFVEANRTLGSHQGYEEFVCEFAFIPNTNTVAVWTVSGNIRFWNAATGQMRRKLQAADRPGSSLISFDGKGDYMLTGNLQSKTRIWDMKDLSIAQDLGEHTDVVKTFSFSPNGRFIATGSDDQEVKIWYKPEGSGNIPQDVVNTDNERPNTNQVDEEEQITEEVTEPEDSEVIEPDVTEVIEGNNTNNQQNEEATEDEKKITQSHNTHSPNENSNIIEKPKDKFVLENVHFVQSTAIFLDSALALSDLNYVIEVMNEYPTLEIELQGHTDNQGNAYLNLILSEQRVEAVKEYLVGRGINENRISTFGFGENTPRLPNNSEKNMQKNRRVEVKVLRY